MIVNLFYIISFSYLVILFSRILGLRSLELTACITGVALNFAELFLLFYQSGNIPVFNIFESFLFVTFILGVTGLILLFKNDSPMIRLWVWIEVIVLLIIMALFPKNPSAPTYNHEQIYIVLFHCFRCISLALMLFATAWFIQFIIQRELNERTSKLAHQGRNFLVLSAVFFLMAEYVGIIWCQNGWGDFWMWSKTFLQSTLIVLYLMLAFHIPGKNRKSEDIRCVIGGLSSVFMLSLFVIRSFY